MSRIVAQPDGPSICHVEKEVKCIHPFFRSGMPTVRWRMSTDPPYADEHIEYFYADEFPENTVAKCDCGEYLVSRQSDMVFIGETDWLPLKWYHFKAHSTLRKNARMYNV